MSRPGRVLAFDRAAGTTHAPSGPDARLGAEVARLVLRLREVIGRALSSEVAAAPYHALLADIAREAGARGAEPGPAAIGPAHPLDRLTAALNLSPVEVELVVLAGLPEEHEGLAAMARAFHPRGEPRITAGLAAQALCESLDERHWLRGTLESGPAARAGLLRLSPEAPFFERTLMLPDGLWSALQGSDSWPAGLERLRPALTAAALRAALAGWLDGAATAPARAALARGEAATLLLCEEDDEWAVEQGRALVLKANAVPAVLALPVAAPIELQRALALHALARGQVPVVRLESGEAGRAMAFAGFAAHPGPVVLACRPGVMLPAGDRPVLPVRCQRLGLGARAGLWAALVPALGEQADALATRYALEPPAIARVARDVAAASTYVERAPALDDVAASVRARSGAAFSAGVKLIRPTAVWDQLVLAPARRRLLVDAIARLRQQVQVLEGWGFLRDRPGARGVRMLFCGPSGTGKTLSAEVVAHELGVDLLLVDISRVVSKWIGETEKNLGEVFNVAEQAQAVLLFDEADALFGKRTEVSDAHDRYANLETAYLLSRLERFEGLAILSSNLRQNMDPAFTRRLEFIVEFDEPEAAEREEIWSRHVPPDAPVERDVSWKEIARLYPVVGGFIRNAAVAAAFTAAAEGTAIGRRHLVRAIKREYEKLGRAFPGYPQGCAPI